MSFSYPKWVFKQKKSENLEKFWKFLEERVSEKIRFQPSKKHLCKSWRAENMVAVPLVIFHFKIIVNLVNVFNLFSFYVDVSEWGLWKGTLVSNFARKCCCWYPGFGYSTLLPSRNCRWHALSRWLRIHSQSKTKNEILTTLKKFYTLLN